MEQWRWNALEALKGKPIVCASTDEEGGLWLGTTTGIARYDGLNYVEYPYSDLVAFGLPTSVIPSTDGPVYVTTARGLFSWEPGAGWSQMLSYSRELTTRNIRTARLPNGDLLFGTQTGLARISGGKLTVFGALPHEVVSVVLDRNGTIWLSTLNEGKVYSCPTTQQMDLEAPSSWRVYETTPGRHPQKTMLCLRGNGELWAVNSLPDCPPLRFDPKSDAWELVVAGFDGIDRHKHEDLIEASDGSLLIHTRNSLLVETRSGWRELKHPEFKIPSSTPFLLNLPDGSFVMGARGDTTFKIDLTRNAWDALKGLHFQCEDETGRQWFLSYEGEVVQYDARADEWLAWGVGDGVIDAASSLFLSSDGVVWAIGSHSGQAALAFFRNGVWERQIHAELGARFSYLSTCERRDGTILFGVGNLPYEEKRSTGGMVAYELEGGRYGFRRLSGRDYAQRVVGIADGSSDGELWLGGELLKLHAGSRTEALTHPSFLSNIWIDHLLMSSRDELWLAIGGVGVARRAGGVWSLYSEADGLVSNQVVHLIEDSIQPGHIWAATDRGVSHFDGKSWTEALFPPSFSINRESGTLKQSRDGAIWLNFGDRDWYFRTEKPSSSDRRNAAGFRSVRYRRQAGNPTIEMVNFEERLAEPGYPYFSWSGMDLWNRTSSDYLEYSYRLDEGEWSDYDRKTETILLGVNPGNHRFEVRVRDGDGNESVNNAVAQFVVVPPLWKRPWFIALMSSVAVALAGSIYIIIQQRIRRIIELEEFKIQFFTNLSHELRTPLTVIIGPLERLVAKQESGFSNTLLTLALKNAQKMNHIVDQLLDFRKTESVEMPEERVKGDVLQFVRNEIDLLQPLVEDKRQSVELLADVERFVTWLDFDKLEKILGNLLSNAIKFTPENGVIRVRIQIEGDRQLKLSVEDQGPGISVGERERVFEPFVQGRAASELKRKGTGIGLALARRLARTCGGEIYVESPCNVATATGTRFVVTLPLRGKPIGESEGVKSDEQRQMDKSAMETLEDSRSTVLVVDDNDDVRSFVAAELGEVYLVDQASDGEAALAFAMEHVPDAIVSDVAMPAMDGNELCRRLKESEVTCHIPIVMLTAHKTPRHELESLKLGADDFVGKPVNIDILKGRIQNLIAARERLRKRFAESATVPELIPGGVEVADRDRAFLEKARERVVENLLNPQFDVERLAEALGMSRMTLYRKLKAVTDMSPNVFIRSVRMKLAAARLKSGKYSVTEVAESVGYQELSYFSASFKKQFGCSPSDFMAQK